MKHLVATTAGLALIVTASLAHAGGTANPGYGSQAQPRAGAFVAKADDPSAIFHNPAGLAKIKGTVIQIGVNLVNFSQSFTRAGSYDQCTDQQCPAGGLDYAGQPYGKIKNLSHGAAAIGDFAVVPLISAVSDFGLDLPIVFAAGIMTPGMGSADREYAPDYNLSEDPTVPPPPGRYDVIRQEVVVLHPSIAAAYRINDKIDLGARVSWGFAQLKAESALWGMRNYEEWEGMDVDFAADAKDNFVPAFGFGALYRPISSVELGFNYRSASNVRSKGTGSVVGGSAQVGGITLSDLLQPRTDSPFRCGGGGTIAGFVTCLDLTLPQNATIGGRWILHDGNGGETADVELDVQWENWSNASQIKTRVDAETPTGTLPPSTIRHGYKDVVSVRLGGSYTLPVGAHKLSIRAGAAYDTETAPTSWTRLDQDGFARTTLGTGVSYEIPGWRFELGGGAILEGKRTVDHGGCNPDIANIGCANNEEIPVADRDAPDPVQPLRGQLNQTQSPFNAGVYEQSYLIFSLGATAWF